MPTIENIPYDDISIGDSADFSKTLTEEDLFLFAQTSGDYNPVHFNDEYAKSTMFKSRIGHGMWTAGLFSTVLGMKLPGPGVIYLGQNLSFRGPVRVGDTVTARMTVTEKRDDKGWITLDCIAINQDGKKVVIGEATAMPAREKIVVEHPDIPEIKIKIG